MTRCRKRRGQQDSRASTSSGSASTGHASSTRYCFRAVFRRRRWPLSRVAQRSPPRGDRGLRLGARAHTHAFYDALGLWGRSPAVSAGAAAAATAAASAKAGAAAAAAAQPRFAARHVGNCAAGMQAPHLTPPPCPFTPWLAAHIYVHTMCFYV